VAAKRKIYRVDGTDAIVDYMKGEKEYLFKEETMDEHGNVLCLIEFDKKGEPERRTDATYKGENILTQKITNLFDDTAEMFEFEYDESQHLVKEYVVYPDEKLLHQEYEYDDQGNLITITYYDDDEVSHRDCFEYDKKGNLVERAQYNNEDEELEAQMFEYNENGQMVKNIFESPDDDGRFTEDHYNQDITLYEYDEHGRRISEIKPEQNYRTSYLYDDKDKMTEYTGYQMEEVVDKHVIVYDDHDRVAQESFFSDRCKNNSGYGGSCDAYTLRYEY